MPRFPLVMLVVFALTLFTSATLLFLVQPMIGKMILPLLGGTPEVWNTCMVFFQAMLLAGYAYAHATTRWLGVRRQAGVHLAVLFVPVLLFAVAGPLAINKSFIVGGANPIAGALLVLVVAVGLPFFVVSTTSPLLQQWFSSTDHPSARDPYFLSTASNMGSMLALVGYPALVEPFLPLRGQRIAWGVGYGLYILLTGTCAVLLWKSGRAVALAPDAGKTPVLDAVKAPAVEMRPQKGQFAKAQSKGKNKKGDRSERVAQQPAPTPAPIFETALSGDVTLWRRLRWVLLAFVPSSLMMGVTTYITTDIAAIPLLWVLPLGLYLLSFILVFAKIPRWVHQAMILAMPLLVLLLAFMMLSEIKPKITYNIMLHLLLMFVVSMVCHGEMVRDRPPTKYLTEFYMWMSFGGVLGGIFNALIAPVIFNSLAEYSLAMVLACMLLPPLVPSEEEEQGQWGRYADLTLVGLFTVIGLFLIWLRLRDHNIPFDRLDAGGWGWPLAAVLLTLAGGTFYTLRSLVRREVRALDIALPVTLLLLTVGLVWGLNSTALLKRLVSLADYLPVTDHQLRVILTFGLPAVLCYTFVERSLRFGLGVGAILLAGAFTNLFLETTVYEKRSFFGVLKVEVGKDVSLVNNTTETLYNNRLVHGTTLHGKQYVKHLYELPQFLAAALGVTAGQDGLSGSVSFAAALEGYDYSYHALTYYHRTGPIGQVMSAFNRSAADRLGVIGLGTGTLASYGRPGQDIVFYDIDRAVKNLSFDRRDYFSFVQDAKARGVNVDLVLGDARLEIERWLEKESGPVRQGDYTVLAVDAFSSDAIPIHLITREAVHLFMQMVREEGVLAYHISNRYLDLAPVLANIAKAEGLAVFMESDREGGHDLETIGKSGATWVVLARKETYLARLMTQPQWDKHRKVVRDTMLQALGLPQRPEVSIYLWHLIYALDENPPRPTNIRAEDWLKGAVVPAPWQAVDPKPDVGVWTDDYSNLLKVFMW